MTQPTDRERALVEAATYIEQCETCCGNGEIVTDWDRYLHSHPGDKGGEAVADCPDCDGCGTIEVTSALTQYQEQP